MSQQNEAVGMDGAAVGESDFGTMSFIVSQMLAKLNTVTLVQVVKCTNSGGVSPVGYVDVQPMVHQMSGDRKATPHAVIHNIPYFRLQGGKNAIIIDPEVGDIGMCAFANRDISSVKATKEPATPASYRTFDWSDGLYFGGYLNGAPTQFVRFSADGIEIKSPVEVKIIAPKFTTITTTTTHTAATTTINSMTNINGALSQGGGDAGGDATIRKLKVETTVTAIDDVFGGGVSLKNHTHKGVVAGPANTGVPN